MYAHIFFLVNMIDNYYFTFPGELETYDRLSDDVDYVYILFRRSFWLKESQKDGRDL